MENIKKIFLNDFRNFLQFQILQFMLVLSLLLAGVMAFLPQIDAMTIVYVSVFIIPVIIFAISLYIENTERKLLPCLKGGCTPFEIIMAKLLSALVLNLIPMVLFILVMFFIRNMHFSVILFILVYLLSAVIHILVGLSLAIIAKSGFVMSVSYIGYIVLFSLVPIFYANNLIPSFFQYVMIVSPAYLCGVLFQNITYGYIFSATWLLVLSVLLPFLYMFLLSRFIVKPYFQSYLLSVTSKQ